MLAVEHGFTGPSPIFSNICFGKSSYWYHGYQCVFPNQDQGMEASALVSFSAFALWRFYSGKTRSIAFVQALFLFASIIALMTFIEASLVWDLHLVSSGSIFGNVWWGEQVTSQTCFIKASNYSPSANNCSFLNYGELFLISGLTAFLAFMVQYLSTDTQRETQKETDQKIKAATS